LATIRNYNAWIKAARKAAAKTGGLSLPAARKAYKKMAARVGRPLKGTDVKLHPRIFRESIPKRSGGRAAPKRTAAVRVARAPGPAAPSKPAVAERAVVKTRRIESIDQFLALAAELFDVGEVEYVSTQEYRKK
jgi:hypothetical protein